MGLLATNCYILKQGGMCLIVDPGDEFEKIEKGIGSDQLLAILITHHHEDHIGALSVLLEKYKVPIYDFYHTKEQSYVVGPFSFDVVTTLGHTSDSIIFYFKKEDMMFVGDFIFKGSIGRTDLPGGNLLSMKKSIDKIKLFGDDIICYPGHGESTILGEEKKYNIFFNN